MRNSGPAAARRLVLASASPARLALLRTAGFDPEVVVSGVDEDGVDHLAPHETARTLAQRKAREVANRISSDDADRTGDAPVVVGCDSVLWIDGAVRGKPSSIDEARAWWRDHAGQRGMLLTGHCVIDVERCAEVSGTAQTEVHFGSPSDAEVEAYLATGEPLQVAGGLTIDGYGAPFVDAIVGDHGTVIGLSLPLLRRLLAEIGIPITELWAKP